MTPAASLRPVLLALLAGTLVLLAGCSGGSSKQTDRAGSSVPAGEFAALAEESGTVVLDVRSPAEYAAGHLARSVNIDVEGAAFDQRIGELDPERTYAVYCQTARRSKVAMDRMLDQGFTDVVELEDGFAGWIADGQPIAR